jgi:hypothetical protein
VSRLILDRAVFRTTIVERHAYTRATLHTKLIGGNFNLIIKKHRKRVVIQPEDDRTPIISLDASDDVFFEKIYDSREPNRILVIYNIADALASAKPSADGRSPLTREELNKAKLNALTFSAENDATVRAIGKALGWDKQMGEIEKTSVALSTVGGAVRSLGMWASPIRSQRDQKAARVRAVRLRRTVRSQSLEQPAAPLPLRHRRGARRCQAIR